MPKLICEGWWEQTDLGRQPMKRLIIDFVDSLLTGSGDDIVGPFTILGRLEADRVVIRKHYVGQHTVEYLGQSMGEGIYHGDWNIDGDVGGRWEIRFSSIADSGDDEILIL